LDRKVDVACVQETRWKGSSCKLFGAKGKRYKLFWMGCEDRLHGVEIFVAEKWVDNVSVERHSKRVLILKMVLDRLFLLSVQFTYLTVFLHTKSLSKFSLVYLLAWHPPLHTLYISSPNHCLLFTARAHTIAVCFAVVPRLSSNPSQLHQHSACHLNNKTYSVTADLH